MNRKVRASLAALTASITIGLTTVAYADDDPVSTTTSTTAAPVVTISVADVPVTTETPPITTVKTDTSVSQAPSTTQGTLDAEVSTTSDAPVESSSTVAASTSVAVVAPTSTLNPVQNSADQQTVITGTQVAGANTGGNITNNDQPANGSVPTNSVGSGAATAVGSDDTNKVTQAADVVLTDQAIANVLQVALILNVGAALANSGGNNVAGTPGTGGTNGAIGTGDASATGLDMSQYITQAARAQGDENTDDAAKQLAVSLWMGIATANSGVNSITGAGGTGTGGAVDSGDASATGNKSLTDILQGAQVNGSDTSVTNVQQYATVLNMGFALANSGVNDIAGVAGGLLTASDDEAQNSMALDLFSMLLPALLQTYASSGGSGMTSTGNATAVGNDSETYIKQLAMAANSGDGIASIIQQVLVANTGAAGANTGGNSIGGRYSTIDPEMAKAVVTLAAFLSQMLAMVQTGASDQAKTLQEQGLEVPFGDIVLTIQGALQNVDTTLTNPNGARANVKQVTIVLSLGIALANSGLNTVTNDGVNQTNVFAASVNDPSQQIGTGDADASNGPDLVIICQRRNADDIECLTPPPPTEGVPATTVPDPADRCTDECQLTAPSMPMIVDDSTPSTGLVAAAGTLVINNPADPIAQPRTAPSDDGTLPTTGMNAATIMGLAALFLAIGAAMVLVRRRRVPEAVTDEPEQG